MSFDSKVDGDGDPTLIEIHSPEPVNVVNVKESLKESDEKSKVPLYFPLIKPGTTHEELLKQLKLALEENIYTWNQLKFQIPFPPTLPRQAAAIKLSDLIRDPDFRGEIYELAFDRAANKLRKLDFMQLQEVRRTGEFSIPSRSFPGQFHVWRLTQFLQKGSNRIANTARQEYATCLKNFVEWIPNRIYRSSFSIPNGVKKIVRGVVWDIPTLLWGWVEKDPEFNFSQIGGIISRKMKKFMLEELKFAKNFDEVDFSLEANQVTSADGRVFDFRLFNKKLAEKIKPILVSLQGEVDAEFQKKNLLLQKRLSTELQKAGSSSNLARDVANMLVKEKSKMLVEKIQSNTAFDRWSNGIVVPIMEMLEADLIHRQAADEYSDQREELRLTTEAKLQREHPILYLIREWKDRKVNEVLAKFDEEMKYYIFTRNIALAEERKLDLTVYLLKRALFFTKEREPALRVALQARKVPSRTYVFKKTIWNPKNWIIKKVKHNYYVAYKHTESTVTSDKLFWRIRTLFYRTITFWNNATFSLYCNIVHGPLGFRSLFSPSSFFPASEVDEKTGELKKTSLEIQSLCSRLGNLWSGIRTSRQEFESKPDVGFLGKSIARVFHLAWNYIFKGLFGTLLLLTLQPLASIINIVVSTLLVLTSMIWCPIAGILSHLCAIFIYDFEAPRYSKWAASLFPLLVILVRQLGYGAFKVGGSLIAIVGNILLYCLGVIGCGVHAGLRSLYDFIVFYLVIKTRGRLPATNSFAAKRIQGPGLSRTTFFQINPDLALVALQVKMELIEMQAYEDEVMHRIEKAKTDSLRHMTSLLSPLGLTLASNHTVLQSLDYTETNLRTTFRQLKEARNKQYPFLIDNVPNRDRIVLERSDLEITLYKATIAVEHFYTTRILPHTPQHKRETFWDDNKLLEGDWNGLARNLLATVFSQRFLSPLEEVDKNMSLKIEHASIHQYAEGLMDTGAIPDDLSVSHVECPNYYNEAVKATITELNAGSPRSGHGLTSSDVHEKLKKQKEKAVPTNNVQLKEDKKQKKRSNSTTYLLS